VGTCSNCRQRHGRLILGRCNTCYRFHKRTGRERDVEQIIRTNALRFERENTNPYLTRLRSQAKVAWRAEAERLNNHGTYVALGGFTTASK
jgi:hypothetical protein